MGTSITHLPKFDMVQMTAERLCECMFPALNSGHAASAIGKLPWPWIITAYLSNVKYYEEICMLNAIVDVIIQKNLLCMNDYANHYTNFLTSAGLAQACLDYTHTHTHTSKNFEL